METLRERFIELHGTEPSFFVNPPVHKPLAGVSDEYSQFPKLSVAITNSMLLAVGESDKFEVRTMEGDHSDWRQIFYDASTALGTTLNLFVVIQEFLNTEPAEKVFAALVAISYSCGIEIDRDGLLKIVSRICQSNAWHPVILGMVNLVDYASEPFESKVKTSPNNYSFVVANSFLEGSEYDSAPTNRNLKLIELRLAAAVLQEQLKLSRKVEMPSLRDVFSLLFQTVGESEISSMIEITQTQLKRSDYSLDEIAAILDISAFELSLKYIAPILVRAEGFALYNRTMHVLSESKRAFEIKKSLESNDLQNLGDILNESHASCRDLFLGSSAGVEELISIGKKHGARGCRIIEAGKLMFLIDKDKSTQLMNGLKEDFFNKKRLLGTCRSENCSIFCDISDDYSTLAFRGGDFVKFLPNCDYERISGDSGNDIRKSDPIREAPYLDISNIELPKVVKSIAFDESVQALEPKLDYLRPIEPLQEEFGYSPDEGRLYRYHYYWPESAESVYLTGDFLDWTQSIRLQRIGQIFTVTLYLPTPKTTIRFIVDGDWAVSDNFWISYDKQKVRCNDIYGEYIEDGESQCSDIESIFDDIPVENRSKIMEENNLVDGAVLKYFNPIEPLSDTFGLSVKEGRVYQYSIKWTEPAERVLITGHFLGSQNCMHLQEYGSHHSITFYLTRSKISIRFIVDGEWQYSSTNWISFDDAKNKCNDLYGDFMGYTDPLDISPDATQIGASDELAIENLDYNSPAESFIDIIDYTEAEFGFSERCGRIFKFTMQVSSDAPDVFVTGDFLGWLHGLKLDKRDELHQLVMFLDIPEVSISFLIRGRWVTSTLHDVCEDPFGNRHNLLRGLNITRNSLTAPPMDILDNELEAQNVDLSASTESNQVTPKSIDEEIGRRRQFSSPLAIEILPDAYSEASNPSNSDAFSALEADMKLSESLISYESTQELITPKPFAVELVSEQIYSVSAEEIMPPTREMLSKNCNHAEEFTTFPVKSLTGNSPSNEDKFGVETVCERHPAEGKPLLSDSELFIIETVMEATSTLAAEISNLIPEFKTVLEVKNEFKVEIVEEVPIFHEMKCIAASTQEEIIVDSGDKSGQKGISGEYDLTIVEALIELSPHDSCLNQMLEDTKSRTSHSVHDGISISEPTDVEEGSRLVSNENFESNIDILNLHFEHSIQSETVEFVAGTSIKAKEIETNDGKVELRLPAPAVLMQRDGRDGEKSRRFSLEYARNKAHNGMKIAQENARCNIL